MKKLTIILFTLFLLPFQSVSGKELSQFSELENILENVYEASFEMDEYFRVIVLDDNHPQIQNCQPVPATELKETIWSAIEKFRDYYPDEELPYEEAKEQLLNLVGQSPYYKCETIIDKESYSIVVRLYISSFDETVVQVESERMKQ